MPLGTPLMDTRVEVRDDQGHVITEGEGQVFIGETELTDTLLCTQVLFQRTRSTHSKLPRVVSV